MTVSTYKGVLIEQSLIRPSRDLLQERRIRKRYQIAFPDPALIDIVEGATHFTWHATLGFQTGMTASTVLLALEPRQHADSSAHRGLAP